MSLNESSGMSARTRQGSRSVRDGEVSDCFPKDADAKPQATKPRQSIFVFLKLCEVMVRNRVQEKFETAHWGDPLASA